MKKFLSLILITLIGATVSFAADKSASGDASFAPSNVKVVYLGNGNGKGVDSLLTTQQCVYGPWGSAVDARGAQFKSLRFIAPTGAMTSGDSVQASYQYVATSRLADTTTGGWVACDTLISAGKTGNFQDISSKSGAYLVFKLKNINAAARTTIMLKRIAVVLVAPSTEYVDVKR